MELKSSDKKVRKDNPFVTYTEHIVDENTRIVVAVNCVPREESVNFTFDGYSYSSDLANNSAQVVSVDNGIGLKMKGNSAFVFEITRWGECNNR